MSLCLVQTEAMEATFKIQGQGLISAWATRQSCEVYCILTVEGAFMCVWKEKGEDDEEEKITRAGADHQEQIE